MEEKKGRPRVSLTSEQGNRLMGTSGCLIALITSGEDNWNQRNRGQAVLSLSICVFSFNG